MWRSRGVTPARSLSGWRCCRRWPLSQAVRLGLNNDMAELLPNDHPGVVALRKLNGRQTSSTNLVILISSPDTATALRFGRRAGAGAAKAGAAGFHFRAVEAGHPDLRARRRWRWLYAELSDLQNVSSLYDRIVAQRSHPLLVDLEGDPEEELRALRKKLEKKLPAQPIPVFETDRDGRHYKGVVLWRRGGGFASLGDAEVLRETQRWWTV